MLRGTDFSRAGGRHPDHGQAQATLGLGMVYWALGLAGQKKSPGRHEDILGGLLSSGPSHMVSVTHMLCHGETQHPRKPGGLPTAAQPGSSRAGMWVETYHLERRQETGPQSPVWSGPQ